MSRTTLDITFRKVVPETNVHRFYRIIVTRNLLGQSVCISQWGRIGSCGQRREREHVNATDAQLDGAAGVLERLKRGYTVAPGLSFIDEKMEQAVALNYLLTLHRGGKVGAAAKAQPCVSARRSTRTNLTQLALWPEGQMPVRRTSQYQQTALLPQHQQMTTQDRLQQTARVRKSAAEATRIDTRQFSPTAPVPAVVVQQATTPTFPPSCSKISHQSQADAQRRARIESILEASRTRHTRSGAPLEVERADNKLLKPLGTDLTAAQREDFIQRASGVPRRGWPVHQRRVFR